MTKKSVKPRTARSFAIAGVGEILAFVARRGQDAANRSDLVIVDGALALPRDSEYGSIHRELQFGERCTVLGQPLTAMWGDHNDCFHRKITGREILGHQTRTCWAAGKTWKAAFADANAHLDREIAKIVEIVEERRKALADAEEE